MGPRTIFEEYAMCPFVLRNNLHSNIAMISYTKSYGLLLVALPTKSGYLTMYLAQLGISGINLAQLGYEPSPKVDLNHLATLPTAEGCFGSPLALVTMLVDALPETDTSMTYFHK